MKDLLQQLYNSEINVSLSSFYDGGFTCKIGDEMNGFKSEKTSTDLDEIEIWLKNTAIELYPESKFAIENSKCKCPSWQGLNLSGNCFTCDKPINYQSK